MPYPKGIVLTFRTFRETTDTILGAVAFESFTSAGDDLMSICLMTHIEDDLVFRCIVNIMKSHDKFHRTKAGTKMTRIHRTTLYHIMTDLFAQRTKGFHIQRLYICRRVDGIQNPICLVFHVFRFLWICEGTKKRYLCKDLSTRFARAK